MDLYNLKLSMDKQGDGFRRISCLNLSSVRQLTVRQAVQCNPWIVIDSDLDPNLTAVSSPFEGSGANCARCPTLNELLMTHSADTKPPAHSLMRALTLHGRMGSKLMNDHVNKASTLPPREGGRGGRLTGCADPKGHAANVASPSASGFVPPSGPRR